MRCSPATGDMKLYFKIALVVVLGILTPRVTSEAAPRTYCVASDGNAVSYNQGFVLKRLLDCHERRTWNEYLAHQSYYFSQSNVRFHFDAGYHRMNRPLDAQYASDLLLYGDCRDKVYLVNDGFDDLQQTPLRFTHFFNIAIKGMTLELCTYNENGVLHFVNGRNATIQDTILNNTCNGSDIRAERVKNMFLGHLSIIKSKRSAGSIDFHSGTGEIHILRSTFKYVGESDRGFKFVFLNFKLMKNTVVTIEHSEFNSSPILKMNMMDKSTTLIMNNVKANGSSVRGSSPCACSVTGDGILHIMDSEFYDFSGAFFARKLQHLYINNTVFSKNLAEGIETSQKASALGLCDISHGILSNVTFVGNGDGNEPFNEPNSPALVINSSSSVTIHNCNFTNNVGHALYSYRSNVTFTGLTYFKGNWGYRGGAIYLDPNSFLHYSKGKLVFDSNKANSTGGAVYISNYNQCPFSSPAENDLPVSKRLVFLNNSAGSGGNDIYVGYINQLYVNNASHCIQTVMKSSKITQNLSSISSMPFHVCLCNSSNKPDCLNPFNLTEAYPGEVITVSVAATGLAFGTSVGIARAQLLVPDRSERHHYLGNEKQKQQFVQNKCASLTYTVRGWHHNKTDTILAIRTQGKFIKRFRSKNYIKSSIEKYEKSNHTFVPRKLLEFPVYINITLKPCPPGFHLFGSQPQCVCHKRLLHVDGVKCHIGRKEFLRGENVWIGHSTGTIVFTKDCPYNYCKRAKTNIFNSFDEQCEWNHTGRLCGECPKGMSLTLGTSQCRQCSNTNLYLLAIFAFGGVALVAFLKVTDLTTAGGLINGLILYANLVKANSHVYFPSDSGTPYIKYFKIFIDWLNLDFGIEVCFFNGLDGYWKTWLQLVFPLYLWMISLTMIFLARYSIKMSRLLGKNSVPVLATLFTLSYAKIFRFIITAMKFTILEDVSGHSTAVWSYDGNIDYFHLKHSCLFVVALVLLLLWLPYTFVLTFERLIKRCRISVVGRMKPLLDAHCGPFEDKHRYWFGFLLVLRTAPLLACAITPTDSDHYTVLSTMIIAAVLLTLLHLKIYTKWYVSFSEAFFLVNLLILACSAWFRSHSPPEYVIMAVLVGIAFLQFALITIFSTLKQVCRGRVVCCGYDRTGSNPVGDDLSYRRSPPQS